MKLFAQITKVDEAKRLVYGRAVQEVPDRSGEIFDYASSRPHFEDWSKGFSDQTDGKSLGNIRAMHGKVAAGKVTAIEYNDGDKAIDIAAKIVDDAEWSKVIEGVYTGFSIGGSYVDGSRKTEKVDGKDIVRYTAKPSEISIVDSPCIPTAKFFDILKADGAVAKVEFKTATPEANSGTGTSPPVASGEADPKTVEKGGEATPPADAKLAVTTERMVKGEEKDVDAFVKALDEAKFTMTDAIEALKNEVSARAQVVLLETVAEMEKREFNAEQRKEAAKSGAALPDGSFPIHTKGDLSNAVKAYGRAKDKAAAKAHIIKRAKALGATGMLPDSWQKLDDNGNLQKGMWNVGRFAECLECIADIASSAQMDFDYEGDESPVPATLRNWLGDGIDVFKAMADEESGEMLASLKTAAGVGPDDEIEMALEAAMRIGTLKKELADPELTIMALAKMAEEQLTDDERKPLKSLDDIKAALVKKAMSRANMDKIQAVHDHAADMGATCGGEKADAGGSLQKLEQTISDMKKELDTIRAMPVPHVQLRVISKEQDGGAGTGDKRGTDWTTRVPLDKQHKRADGSIDWMGTANDHDLYKQYGTA